MSGEMVRAIIEGRKTQTRRVWKYQPLDVLPMRVPNKWVTLDTREPEPHGKVARCRFGVPGDRLWVRESFRVTEVFDSVYYRADDPDPEGDKWRPSIFMPRWASRLTLEITGVRVERLQKISGADILAEGIRSAGENGELIEVDEFAKLWDRINGKRAPWSSTPWVWVIEFRRLDAIVPQPAWLDPGTSEARVADAT